MNFLGFGSSVSFVFKVTSSIEGRPLKRITKRNGVMNELLIFLPDEPLRGSLQVIPQGKVEHVGVKIELVGEIELNHDRGNPVEFIAIVRELDEPGTLLGERTYDFDFSGIEKPYDSYNGVCAKLRYFLRATVSKTYTSTWKKEQEFWVEKIENEPIENKSIKMQVGIEDCLHIEFEFEKSKYALSDVLIGKVFFLLVKVKIKHMELWIFRKETIGSGDNASTQIEKLINFEVMDGCPVRGEAIPIRMFLKGGNLTPTYENVNNLFSVRYTLQVVLVDEEGRRYFKPADIELHRRTLG